MFDLASVTDLPALPFLLWETPPGVELMLRQEGLPHQHVRDPHRHAFTGGRFVLFDGRTTSRRKLSALLSTSHVAIDLDHFRQGLGFDPFEAVVENRASAASWVVAGARLTEQVASRDRASIRRQFLTRLRAEVSSRGGVWARLAPFPHPYRSAFNLRIDLDEPAPDDYARFAKARRPLDDCSTHFVCTHAYGSFGSIMAELRRLDTQSHGHFHFVYRDEKTNERNLSRAHDALSDAGIHAAGFAAPGGRWNEGLDSVLERLGYQFSSDFHLGFDDVPFFPWVRGRFSTVLQVPVHPVCEGLFLEAGIGEPALISSYLRDVVRSRVEAHEPAFVYGHPEGRLGRFPQVVTALADEVASHPNVWRVGLTEFARWWRWRDQRRWSLLVRPAGGYEVQFEEWDTRYPLALELYRGDHLACLRLDSPRVPLNLKDIAFVKRNLRFDRPSPVPARQPWTLKHALRTSLDWETVTPIDELPVHSARTRMKKRLRRFRSWRKTP